MAQSFTSLQDVAMALAIVGLEIGVVLVAAGFLHTLATHTLRRAGRTESFAAMTRPLQQRVRNVLLAASVLLALAILGYNGWLVSRGVDVTEHTAALAGSISGEMWIGFALALGKLTAAALGFLIAARVIRRLLGSIEAALNRRDQLKDNSGSLAVLFTRLHSAIVNTGWMLVIVLACWLFAVPQSVVDVLLLIVRVYVIIAVGLMIIRSTVVIVDTLDGLSHRYAHARGWLSYYDELRPLAPNLRMCLEYALWIALASLVLVQFGAFQNIAARGPLLIQAIGMFFIGRVVIELGKLEIGRRMLPAEGLDEVARRRRETIAPLICSTFAYAVYFATAVLILGLLGFNPMPFLAGAGILGLVVGFGAQSLINDVVSGFFILFENTYHVGDVIEAAGAKGVVENIEFRTTKIRDGDGRVHVVRNGDVKQVVNYSKKYAMAVVSVDVAYDADLRSVFAILREAGERVHAENPDVLADSEIDGITGFGVSTMTVRTSTRVKPGSHEAAAAALRLAIKEAFDRQASGAARKGLIPEGLASAGASLRRQGR